MKIRCRSFRDRYGLETLQTSDGSEAAALARDQRPHLIMLMDHQLPNLDVARLLRQDDTIKAIPIIAITTWPIRKLRGNVFERDDERALENERKTMESGCDAYIRPPIIWDEIISHYFAPEFIPEPVKSNER
jgi:CheY-like chemotaxis protein